MIGHLAEFDDNTRLAARLGEELLHTSPAEVYEHADTIAAAVAKEAAQPGATTTVTPEMLVHSAVRKGILIAFDMEPMPGGDADG